MKRHEEETLEGLRNEIHELERRVEVLEHDALERSNGHRAEPAVLPAAGSVAVGPDFGLPNAIPVAGRAILGLAGAYLLRALAESGAAPRLMVVAFAILYAAAWLVFSARAREPDAFTRATYVITASLMLAPLLWEATVRFEVLPPAATAGILIAFVMLGSVLAGSPKPGTITFVVTLSAVVTAVGLMVRTGDLVPFAAALLAIA